MNKQILSIFVLCAFSYSTQAQEVKGGISDSMMQQIKQSYANTPTDKAIRNAIGSNDIRKLALNQDNLKGMDTHFSIKVPSDVYNRQVIGTVEAQHIVAQCYLCQRGKSCKLYVLRRKEMCIRDRVSPAYMWTR